MPIAGLILAASLLLGFADPDPVRDAIDAGDRVALQKALAGRPQLDPVCGSYELCKPLTAAAMQGDLAMVEMLIAAGADPNGRNAYDDTAFMMVGTGKNASKRSEEELAAIRAYLLRHGADPNQTNQFDMSAFSGSAGGGDIAMMEIAHQNGALINHQSPKRRSTPLMVAAFFGEAKAVRWLLAHGADASLRDAEGKTARAIALARHHDAVVALLPAD